MSRNTAAASTVTSAWILAALSSTGEPSTGPTAAAAINSATARQTTCPRLGPRGILVDTRRSLILISLYARIAATIQLIVHAAHIRFQGLWRTAQLRSGSASRFQPLTADISALNRPSQSCGVRSFGFPTRLTRLRRWCPPRYPLPMRRALHLQRSRALVPLHFHRPPGTTSCTSSRSRSRSASNPLSQLPPLTYTAPDLPCSSFSFGLRAPGGVTAQPAFVAPHRCYTARDATQ